MSVGERIKDLRTQKKLTQTDLAKLVGLTYIQVGRYETQKSNPSSDVLQKLAAALDTTADFLMNGSSDEVVATQLTDKELLRQFKEVEQLNNEDKHLVKTFIDAFLTKRHVQKLAH
ncbi:MAG: helix-turn-helix transcriptional regulator [Ekhidna sp.]|nr:helix-turn-helix transcriptional regulator [Ekhidna sp.]